jgi:putative ABC transport system substrate-binding protein
MRWREFIGLLGVAVVWPLAADAQQPQMPVIGYLDQRSAEATVDRLRGFHRGLKESGFVEGENVAIVYRWGEGQTEKLPELAADLVRRKVAVIASTGGIPSTLAARDATTTIPIVFTIPEDPVKIGFVSSLARPDRNLTGINFLNSEIVAKRLELLHELVPTATRIAVLINPANPGNLAATLRDAQSAARAMGLQIKAFNASTSREIDAAIAAIVVERSDALFVSGDGLFNSRRLQLAVLAASHRLPTASTSRDYPASGGLMSYGADVTDALRQTGVYAGRILKGAKPVDLPVLQSTKIEFVINHQTARALGITVPHSLLARADEVIE